jgi:hypothetical protein
MIIGMFFASTEEHDHSQAHATEECTHLNKNI